MRCIVCKHKRSGSGLLGGFICRFDLSTCFYCAHASKELNKEYENAKPKPDHTHIVIQKHKKYFNKDGSRNNENLKEERK